MTDWIALQARAADVFEEALAGATDWDAATPCSSWTAREVLSHVVDEQLWVPGLLAGGTIDEVAEDLEGPLRRLREMSGPDLVDQWSGVRAPVSAAWRGTDADTQVNLSYGSAPAGHYLAQQTFDLAVHAWDIAASQGRDLPWGDDLEQAVLEFVRTDLAENPAPDLFDPPIPGFDGPGAPARHTALALTGRDPGRWPRG
ncbi:TIGR03086 family metal-binding protein [Dietzia sp. NPDC055343]